MPESALQIGQAPPVLDNLLVWYQSRRDSKTPLKVIDKDLDRMGVEATQVVLLKTYPPLNQDVLTIVANNALLPPNPNSVSFLFSPLVRLHSGFQELRKELQLETLERAENIVGIPEDVSQALNSAWHEFRHLPIQVLPEPDPLTLRNLAHLAETTDRLFWESFVEGFRTANTLLKRTLAAKMVFHKTVGLGYNRAASWLCASMVSTLELVTLCSSYQLEADRRGYMQRVRTSINTYLKHPKFAHYLREGGMWSDEMYDRPEIQDWLAALETGIPPDTLK